MLWDGVWKSRDNVEISSVCTEPCTPGGEGLGCRGEAWLEVGRWAKASPNETVAGKGAENVLECSGSGLKQT